MRITMTKPLFAWDCLDDSPNLKTIQQFLQSVPDARLLAACPRREGTLGKMRLGPIAKALHEKLNL